MAANAVGATVDAHVGVNGLPGHAATWGAKGKATCAFTNDSGTAVSTISIDSMQGGGDTVYWMEYEPGVDESGTITFSLTGPSGSPFAKEVQTFNYNGTSVAPLLSRRTGAIRSPLARTSFPSKEKGERRRYLLCDGKLKPGHRL